MSKSIRLSQKHGVNPCIPVCFFCGEEKSEIALLGKLPGDAEAPMSAVLDYEPCDKCKANMSMGVTLLGVTDTAPDNRPPLKAQGGAEVYPTGHYLVVSPDAVSRWFNTNCIKGDKIFVEQPIIDEIVRQNQANT